MLVAYFESDMVLFVMFSPPFLVAYAELPEHLETYIVPWRTKSYYGCKFHESLPSSASRWQARPGGSSIRDFGAQAAICRVMRQITVRKMRLLLFGMSAPDFF